MSAPWQPPAFLRSVQAAIQHCRAAHLAEYGDELRDAARAEVWAEFAIELAHDVGLDVAAEVAARVARNYEPRE